MINDIQFYLNPYKLFLKDGMVVLEGNNCEQARGPDVQGLWDKLIENICKYEMPDAISLATAVVTSIKFIGGIGSYANCCFLTPRQPILTNSIWCTLESAKNYLASDTIRNIPEIPCNFYDIPEIPIYQISEKSYEIPATKQKISNLIPELSLLEIAEEKFNNKDYFGAIDLLTQWLVNNPKDSNARFLLGKIHFLHE